MSWSDVAKLMNSELNQDCSPNKYRKEFTRKFKYIKSTVDFSNKETADEELLLKINEQLTQIRREKTALTDLRRDANAQLRRVDREQNIIDIAKEFAKEMSRNKNKYKLSVPKYNGATDNTGLLLLSDWHYDEVVDEAFNYYDKEVCKEYLQIILAKTIDIIHKENLNSLYVFNLGDLISGRIHTQLRIQSQIDVVSQVMEVSEILYNFLMELSQYCKIEYYDCLDNHSRIEPNKKESIQLESFARITHWYLNSMCDKYRITVHQNNSLDIIHECINGWDVVGVHGDKDSPATITRNMSSLLGARPDLIVMAHRHHFSCDEENKCIVVCNPSLMGADDYALGQRKTSSSAQTLIVLSEDNPAKQIYRLLVN